MKRFVLVFIISLSILHSADSFAAWDCKYSRDIEREVSLANITSIKVVAGAGDLNILGDDQNSVRVKAKLCASDKDELEQMGVSDVIDGEQLRIDTEFADSKAWSGGSNASIDLQLEVPSNMALTVKDSSGSAELSNLASLIMVDSSGGLEITRVAGDVDVKDSSGGLEISKVGGNVAITDSSGAIEVSDVKRDLLIRVDSSGGIDARNIGGSVFVKTDSSGDIKVEQVAGDFTVGSDSSGIIYHDEVAGKVSLPK